MEYENNKEKKLFCVIDNIEYLFVPIIEKKKILL